MRKPAISAGYSTPMKLTDLPTSVRSRSERKEGPTVRPTVPGSVVPRAKNTVTSAQLCRAAGAAKAERARARMTAGLNIAGEVKD